MTELTAKEIESLHADARKTSSAMKALIARRTYDERIAAMKAKERRIDWKQYPWEVRELEERNVTRLAAYKRKRLAHDAFNSYDAAMTAKGLV